VLLTFTVRDTGIGIAAEGMDRLFRSFSQVDASTTRLYGGTGLGLAISRSIVQAMGGDITATSRVGAGSTFSFTLALTPCPPLEAPAFPVLPAHALAGRRALLVDDNSTSRAVLGLQLREWGLDCVEVPDARQALTALQGGDGFDVALLDEDMPDVDGIDLARQFHAQQAGQAPHGAGTAPLPLVLLAGLTSRPAPDAAALFAALHPKPVRPDALQRTLCELFALPHAAAATRAPEAAELPVLELRVLVAEDNPVNQQVADLMLRKLGCRPDIVGDGQQAVVAVRDGHYDLVLMDVHMPVLDGLDATRQIRGLPAPLRQPRIVAMTASSVAESRDSCVRAGMDGHLSKPVRLEDLAATLARTSERPTAAAAVGSRSREHSRGSAALAGIDRRLGAVLTGLDPEQTALARKELLNTYLDQAGQQLTALRSRARAGDSDGVASLAHTLYGSSANIGADCLAGLSRQLEAAVRDGSAGPVHSILDELELEHGLLTANSAGLRNANTN